MRETHGEQRYIAVLISWCVQSFKPALLITVVSECGDGRALLSPSPLSNHLGVFHPTGRLSDIAELHKAESPRLT